MISESKVIELVNSRIDGSEIFLVDVTMGQANDIRVLVDTMEGVRIEACAELSRWLNTELYKIDENFSLEVSSPGLGSPLVKMQQYKKNIGRDVEVIFNDGKKKKGKLTEVDEAGITLETTEKLLSGGSQKKKKHVQVTKEFDFKDIKSTKIVIEF
ncbi:MAG: ribosome assembly cofactor RimP [Bacteroidales bacterium]